MNWTQYLLEQTTVEELAEAVFSCAIDGCNGIYVGQCIGEVYGHLLTPEDCEVLAAGPDHEEYYDAWSEALDAIAFQYAGDTFRLHAGDSGDVFEVNQSIIDAWELATGQSFWDSIN